MLLTGRIKVISLENGLNLDPVCSSLFNSLELNKLICLIVALICPLNFKFKANLNDKKTPLLEFNFSCEKYFLRGVFSWHNFHFLAVEFF